MITARLIGDAELRRLEKLPGAAERRIAGALARLGREWPATTRNEPSGDAPKAHDGAPASSIAGVRADLRRMRRAFGRPIAKARRDMRPPGRRGRLAGHALAHLTLADLEPAIRAEIADALHEALR